MTYVNARTAVRTRTWMRAWELGEARSQLFRWNEFCSGHVSRVLTFAMKLLPFLNAVEGRFSPESSLKWMDKYWTVSLYIAVFYVVLVLAGRYWMRDRPAYGFRRALLAWNVGLAVFSTISAVTIFPSQLDIMLREGVGRGVCWSLGYTDPKIGLWTFLFILSKVAELGDTAFIVLRKSPLTVLHVYHHASVLVFCWFMYTTRHAYPVWFMILNSIVHSVMYSYYAVKAFGFRVPSKISQCVTFLQLAQFVIAINCTMYAFYLKSTGLECDIDFRGVARTLILYLSYTVFFLNFFYQRYVKKGKKE